MPSAKKIKLLPDGFYHPLHLLWIVALPLLALFIINAQTVWFVYDELHQRQELARRLLWLNGGFASGMVILALTMAGLKRRLNVGWLVALLAAGIVFIWRDVVWLERILPSWGKLPNWMLDRDYLLLAQFSLVMPLCFYSLLGIACLPLRLKRWLDISASGGVFIGVPLLWYLAIYLVRGIFHLGDTTLIILFIISAAFMFVGLFRLLTRLYHWLERYRFILILLGALLLPLGGLILNRWIPFPVNFQLVAVYAWTVANGAVLLLDCLPRLRGNRWLWLAQCASFPFTVYFFVVFLPFLAGFLPALIVCGAGFLGRIDIQKSVQLKQKC